MADPDGDGVYGDTVEVSAVYDAEWREGAAAGSASDPAARLFFSTEAADLADWPEEFRALDQDPDSPTYNQRVPQVIGDQDVVSLYTDVGGPLYRSAGDKRLGVQVARRVVLISTGLERDVMFLHWKLTNATAYLDPAEASARPHDLRGLFADLKTDFDIGAATDDASAVLPTLQTALAYDSDFREAAFGRQPGIFATTLLYSPAEADGIDNPTALEPAGNGLVDETFGEIMAAGLRHPVTGQPLVFPEEVRELKAERCYLYTLYTYGDQRPDPFSDAEAYRILSAAPGAGLLPAYDPYAGFLEATVIEDLRQNLVAGPFELAARGAPAELWAACCFAPAANDPAVNGRSADLSRLDPAGEFSRVLALSEAARRTFEGGFLRPRPPSAPEFRLVPGDRQVAISWSELPVTATLDEYASSFQAGQLSLRDSLPESFPRIDGYRERDFEGFRVYRSLTGERQDARLIAQFDLDNHIVDYTVTRTVTISGFTGAGPWTLPLGTDTGLAFSFVDRGEDLGGLVNGMPVFYTVTAYDFNPYNYGGESLESNLGFKRQDAAGNFAQQVTPRGEPGGTGPAGWEAALPGLDGAPLPRLIADTLGSSSDTVTVDPLDPTNRAVVRHNLVLDFRSAPAPQAAALVPGEVELIHGAALPDSGVFVIDSVEAAGPATARYHVYYHYRDSDGRVMAGSALNKTFAYARAEAVATFRFHGLVDSLGVTYSGSVELRRGGRADAKVAPLRVNGVTGTLASPGVNYPHPLYRFTALPATVAFPGAPFLVHQPVNLDQLNSDFPAGESARTTGNIAAFAPGDLEIIWQDDRTLRSVRDLTHGVEVRPSQFTDDGWGFLPLDTHDYEDIIWQSLQVHPKHSRSYRLQPRAVYAPDPEGPQGSEQMALYLRGVELRLTAIRTRPKAGDLWLVRCEFNNPAREAASFVPGQQAVFRFRRAEARPELERIERVRVVPNPYLVSSPLDSGPEEKTVMFVGLPRECTIRVYTISGVLVNVLEHGPGVAESSFGAFDPGSGARRFDLRNRFGAELASGTYYFHVESRVTGEKFLGKFSIIN